MAEIDVPGSKFSAFAKASARPRRSNSRDGQVPKKSQIRSFKRLGAARLFGFWNLVLLWCLVFGARGFSSHAAETNDLIATWLNAQTNVQTWEADFIQTRALKSLAQPLKASGHVWFAAPNRFRWELREPQQTIAVRQPDEMFVIYPRLKRAERYPLTGAEAGPWRDVMALLQAGFPRSQQEMESQYHLLSQHTSDDVCEVTLQPKSAAARRMMPQIKIGFSTNDFALRSTELQFADGSTMRNDFKNSVLNPKIDDTLFAPKLGNDIKIVEPLKK